MENGLLTVAQTAEYLQLSEKTVRRLISEEKIVAYKVGDRSWRIKMSDIDAYMTTNSNTVSPSNDKAPVVTRSFVQKEDGPRLISLFSGCGGLDTGFIKAGFRIVYANDFDSDAQAVYSKNLGEIDGRNIMSVDASEIPDGDILTAGFPCQPFSNAGNRKGVHDSRGMLYKEC